MGIYDSTIKQDNRPMHQIEGTIELVFFCWWDSLMFAWTIGTRFDSLGARVSGKTCIGSNLTLVLDIEKRTDKSIEDYKEDVIRFFGRNTPRISEVNLTRRMV